MPHVPELIALFAVDLLAAMTPGPNFVLVTQTAVRQSFRHGAAVVLGLIISNLSWCAAVLFGLRSLFQLAPWLCFSGKFSALSMPRLTPRANAGCEKSRRRWISSSSIPTYRATRPGSCSRRSTRSARSPTASRAATSAPAPWPHAGAALPRCARSRRLPVVGLRRAGSVDDAEKRVQLEGLRDVAGCSQRRGLPPHISCP
jgi:hypothetical protein